MMIGLVQMNLILMSLSDNKEGKDMSGAKARETLGLAVYDTPLKAGLEGFKAAEVKLLEVTKDEEEQKRIKLYIKAIDTLLKLGDYDVE